MQKAWAASRIVGVVVLSSVALTSCSATEPTNTSPASNTGPLSIAVNASSTESTALGGLYQTAFTLRGRSAEISYVNNTIDQVMLGDSELVIGCTGDFLETFNPALAHTLEHEYSHLDSIGANDPEWREKTYDGLLGSLPHYLAATDPSNAVGCANSVELPQNIVPLFRTAFLESEDREILNWVGGAVDTKDVKTLVKATASNQDSTEVYTNLLRQKGFAA